MLNKSIKSKSPAFNLALAYQGFSEEPVPSVIFDAIESGSLRQALKIALIGLAFVAGILVSLIIDKFNASSSENFLSNLPADQLAISAHKTYANDLVYPVQVGATDMEHLNNWVAYRVGSYPHVQELNDIGFKLLGANIIPDGLAISTMVVYENNNKERFSILTRNHEGSIELSHINADSSHGLNVLAWQVKGSTHTMVSGLDKKAMRSIFDRLQDR